MKITVYKNDVKISGPDWLADVMSDFNQQCGGSRPRGYITRLSAKSASRLNFVARNWRYKAENLFFCTLTYPGSWFPTDGKDVKADLDAFSKRFRRTYPTASYLWVLEFQRRGAPHFHLLVDCPNISHIDFRGWLKSNWYDVVGSGDHNHYLAGTQCDLVRSSRNCATYFAKYAVKNSQKEVPPEYSNVGRFWGKCGRVDVSPSLTLDTKDLNLNISTFKVIARSCFKYCEKRAMNNASFRRKVFKLGQYVFGDTLRDCSGIVLQLFGFDDRGGIYV